MTPRFVVVRNGSTQRHIGETLPDGSVEVVADVSVTEPDDDLHWDRTRAIEERAVELVRLLNLGRWTSTVDLTTAIAEPGGRGA